MKVYGVDLGTRRIAVACPEIGYVWSTSLESSRLRRQFSDECSAGEELGRLATAAMYQWLNGVPERPLYDLPLFIAERPFVGKSIKTAIGQALSASAAMTMLPGAKVLLKHPSLWKKALCGNGNASKDDVRAWIERHHPSLAEACGQDQDRFDAVGIAIGGSALARDGDL